jgi:hypothetical protein
MTWHFKPIPSTAETTNGLKTVTNTHQILCTVDTVYAQNEELL